MMYKEKIVNAPKWFTVGANVMCDGEGSDILTVDYIEYNESGIPQRAVLDGCYEPLSKIYHPNTYERIYVAVGHCDKCNTSFPDSHVRFDINGLNLCRKCNEVI